MVCLLLSNFLMDFFGIYVVIKSNFCTFGCILVNNYGFYFTFPNFCRSFQANLHCLAQVHNEPNRENCVFVALCTLIHYIPASL